MLSPEKGRPMPSIRDEGPLPQSSTGGASDRAWRRSLDSPEEFWAEAAADIVWEEPWADVLDDSRPPFYRWFVGGKLNTCYNAVDRHVDEGRGDQVALIYDSPVTGAKATF